MDQAAPLAMSKFGPRMDSPAIFERRHLQSDL